MPAELADDLIGHLYDAAIDARLWSGMAQRIATAFDSTSCVIKFQSATRDVHILEMTDNMLVTEDLHDWAEDWHRRDLWVQRSVAHGLDRIVTDEILVTPQEQQSSGYYGEFLAHFDIHHMVGAAFSTGEDAVGVLGIHRPKGSPAYDAVCRHRLAAFLPHLQRAVRLSRHLSRAQLAQAATLDVLDRLDTGVIVLDRFGGLVHANSLGEDMLRDGDAMRIANGRVYLNDLPLHARFMALLRTATASATGQSSDAAAPMLLLPRDDRLPLTLSVAPLRPGWSHRVDPGPLALVLIKHPERPSLHLDSLRLLFGFTPTEAVVAADLGAGQSLEGIALRHGMGIGTVRWHLKHILAKTRTTRQGEVVALLARSTAALPGRR